MDYPPKCLHWSILKHERLIHPRWHHICEDAEESVVKVASSAEDRNGPCQEIHARISREGLHSTPGWAYLSLSRIGQECCEKTCAAVNCSLPGWAPNQSKELEIGSTPEAPKASKSWGGRTLAKRVSSVSTAKAGKIIIMNIMWVLTHRHITRLMILLLAKCWGDWKGNIILWQSSLNRLSRSSFSDRRVFCVCLFEGFTLCGYLWLLYFMQLHLHLPERLLSMAPSLWRHRQKYCSCPQPTIALRMAILMRKDDKIDLSICFLPCFVCWLTECLVVLPS